MRGAALGLLLALAACGGEPAPSAGADESKAARTAPAPAPAPTPPAAAAPEADSPSRSPEESAAVPEEQAALTVAKAYFDAIRSGDYDAAWALRWKGEGDDAASRKAFRDHYARYADHNATVGMPGPVEGAAGSLYVEIPVQLYGRLKTGTPFSSAGVVTLRRVNDVPGSTAEQRRWRIYSRD